MASPLSVPSAARLSKGSILRALARPKPACRRPVSHSTSSETRRSASSSSPSFNRSAALAASVAAASFLAYTLSSSRTIQLDDQAPRVPPANPLRVITAKEILSHSTEDSCWVVISGQVWDVTDYLPNHPGGKAIILAQAGYDATDLFKPIHPANTLSNSLPASALVGTVDTATSYQLQKDNGGPEDSEEIRQGRRDALPPVGSIINLHQMEEMAKRVLGKESKTYSFYASKAEDGVAFRSTLASFSYLRFRPRVLVPVQEDTVSTTFLPSFTSPTPSSTSSSPPTTGPAFLSPLPIFISPAARAGAGHPDSERTLVRGSASRNITHCISSAASLGMDEIVAERERVGAKNPMWFQLYVSRSSDLTEAKVRAAVAGGATALVLTVDLACQGKREDDLTKLGLGQSTSWEIPFDADMDWGVVKWLQKLAPGVPILLKGIATPEDALLARSSGCAGIILSNHGGRQLDSAPPPLETLLRIRATHPDLLSPSSDFSVMLDGGVRRGSDVVKALCVGARGVGLGRPFLYAQSAYGEQGVERVVDIIEQEIHQTMRLLGAQSIADLKPEMIGLLDGLVAKDI